MPYRYKGDEDDQKTAKKLPRLSDFDDGRRSPTEKRAQHAAALKKHHRSARRTYLAELVDDVDIVIGSSVAPGLYAAAIIALAIQDLELDR